MNNDDIMAVLDAVTSNERVAVDYKNSTVTAAKPDLSGCSTRDLLNECFRRGAIKQMEYKVHIPQLHLHDKEYVEHFRQCFLRNAFIDQIDKLSGYGVFNIGQVDDKINETVRFSCDYFICKHPLTIKAEDNV